MCRVVVLFTVFILSLAPNFGYAAEGSNVAGISGGSDMRSALLPPPGLYAAGIAAASQTQNYFDNNGNRVAAFNDLEFKGRVGALALLYVPDFKLAGGSFGLLGAVFAGDECGRILAFNPFTFASNPKRCTTGWGDPYVEMNWSRFFGTLRPSRYEGAFPISEGLAVQFGLGVVIPVGQYDATQVATNGLSIGNNLWNVAPMAAFTYTSPPILAEGTEISAKLYWNNYRENSDTQYRTGDILSMDFALTERIGPFQIGIAGTYVDQIENDEQFGFSIDNRIKGLSLGPVIAWDLPEAGVSMKLKLQKSIIQQNTVKGLGAVFTIATKLY